MAVPETIIGEGMIVSYQNIEYGKEKQRIVAEVLSVHPCGVLVRYNEKIDSFLMDAFLKLNPFPVGRVVKTKHWWYGVREEWVYGSEKK